jgi:hypothetical protein
MADAWATQLPELAALAVYGRMSPLDALFALQGTPLDVTSVNSDDRMPPSSFRNNRSCGFEVNGVDLVEGLRWKTPISEIDARF